MLYPKFGAVYPCAMSETGPKVHSPRTVDARKTRRALAKLRRAVAAAEGGGVGLSAWEAEFAESVETRLEIYGSAFTDPAKGALEEPLSARQAMKLREIARQAKGKRRPGAHEDGDHEKRGTSGPRRVTKGFGRRAGARVAPRARDVEADVADLADAAAGDAAAAPRSAGAALTVIEGGRSRRADGPPGPRHSKS